MTQSFFRTSQFSSLSEFSTTFASYLRDDCKRLCLLRVWLKNLQHCVNMPSRELLYEYGIDATAATYITCYIVAIQTFGFTVALFYRAKSIAFNLQNRSHTAIVYFLSFGLANLCSGITHQFYPHTQHYSGTPTGFYIFWISVLISQLSRLSCFMLICDLLSYETGNELLTDIYRALNALIFLLFVGPIVQCCCCKSLSGSPPKQFRVWMVISFVIWIPFVIMSFMILDFYYTAVLQSLIFIYFIPKSVMDLRANTNKSSGCQPDYWYIASSITAVIAIAIYSPFAAGCIHNVCFQLIS